MNDFGNIQMMINQTQTNLNMSFLQTILLAQQQTQAVLPIMTTNECCMDRTTHKTNCCNCGAPLRIYKCDYCGTINH